MTPTFQYKAKDENGNVFEATADAESKYELYRERKQRGEQVLNAEEAEHAGSWWHRLLAKMRQFTTIKTDEKINFARNLGLMLEAGLSVSRALSVLRRQASNARLERVIQEIEDDIGSGHQLYEALKKHPKVFSRLFTSMVKAGEESGNLAQSLQTISKQMSRAHEITKKVRGAMIYPAVIIVIMIAIGILAMLFIVPTLTQTFESLGVDLPLSTRIIIGISDFLRNYWMLNIFGILVAAAGVIMFFRSKVGQRTFDFTLLHIPIINTIVKQVNAARTARTLASLIGSGVDYVLAIGITRDVVQNSYYKEVLDEAEKGVESGTNLSEVLAKYEKLYPVFVNEMMSVGEETGQIDQMLENTADFYESEVANKTKNLSTIIEPILMVIMGVGVGLFALSMIQPMYSLVNAI